MTEIPLSPAPAPARDAAGSLPIAAYALLSDCTTAALVGTDGSVDWLCLPRFDADAVFARLLDPDAGHCAITPVESYGVERRYLPGTLVLETTFTTASGTVRLVDALAFPPGQRGHDLGLDAPHELLRRVEGVSGEVELELTVAPRPEYGLVQPLMRRTRRRRPDLRGPEPRRRPHGRARGGHGLDAARALRPGRRRGRRAQPALGAARGALGDRHRPRRRGGPPRGRRRGLALLGGRARRLRRAPPRARALQRPRPEGPHVPADRRDRRRRHHLAAGGCRAASATGTTASRGSATPP